MCSKVNHFYIVSHTLAHHYPRPNKESVLLATVCDVLSRVSKQANII